LAVHLGGGFAVEDHAADGVFGLDLCEDERWEYGDLEDYEDAVLEGGARGVEVEIEEAGEKGDGDVVKEASKAIVGCSLKYC
jgi:hypothetical protein